MTRRADAPACRPLASRLGTFATQRTACSRVRLGSLLAAAVSDLTTREQLGALIEEYASNVGAQVRGETKAAITRGERPPCRDCAESIEPGRPNAQRCIPCGIEHERAANVERKRKRRNGHV